MTKDRKQTSRGWATGEPSGVPPAPQDPRYAPHVIPHSLPPYTHTSPHTGSLQHGSPGQVAAHPQHGSPAYAGAYPQHGSPRQAAAYAQHGSSAPAYSQHGSSAPAYSQHGSSPYADANAQQSLPVNAAGYAPPASSPAASPQRDSTAHADAYPQHRSQAHVAGRQHGSSARADVYSQHGSSPYAAGYSPHHSSTNPDAYPQQISPGYADSSSPHTAYPHDSAPLHAGYPSASQRQSPYAGAPVSPTSDGPSRATEPPAAAARSIQQATVGVSQRVRFLRLTYLHLLLAIGAFAGLLRLLMTNPTLGGKVSAPLIKFALGGRWNWGVVLVVFMAVSWIAETWAGHARSRAMQYLGLAFYVVAEALIFVPLLAIVEWKTQAILARGGAEPHIVRDAAFVTLGIFTALTLSVFLSRKDFSFLRSGLVMASGAALSLIAMSLVFGFGLGLVFSVAMVLLAAGYVLYHTSHVLAHHDPRHHVAAALALFSSVALMFWYVIRIFLRARE